MALPRFTSLAVSGAALAAMIAYVEIPATSPALARVPDTPAIAAVTAPAPGTKAAEPGLEGSLAALVDDIEANRLDSAMQRVDRLIDEYPKFRLAHLIKGDLLLARAGPLSEFGQGGKSKAWEQVADLREEAIELLLCAADLCSMSLAVVEFADNAHALRTARQAWLAVDGWMIDEHGDVREWERAVVLEAAGLLLDGWNPGDKVVLR